MPKETVPSKLKKRYEDVCNEYLQLFIKKHGYEFSFWVGDDVGDCACFIDQYFFSFSDIAYDINTKCKKGLIFEWHDYNLELGENAINYYSYSKGLRMDSPKKHSKK